MHSNELSRRTLLGAVAALAVAPQLARAATTDQAVSFVNQIVGELMQIVRSSQSQSAALRQFEQMFDRYGDVPVIARSVLGQPWNSMSGGQQSAFVTAFRGYVANKYGSQFREFQDAQVQVTGAKDFGERGLVVSSRVSYAGSSPVAVDWQVSDRSGSLKMFNVLIEGVSMLTTERSEIRALLAQNGNNVDALIADLQRRGA
ncbi:MAG: ABC transporter substrate-binding protein [Pseudomonadota bacterium]